MVESPCCRKRHLFVYKMNYAGNVRFEACFSLEKRVRCLSSLIFPILVSSSARLPPAEVGSVQGRGRVKPEVLANCLGTGRSAKLAKRPRYAVKAVSTEPNDTRLTYHSCPHSSSSSSYQDPRSWSIRKAWAPYQGWHSVRYASTSIVSRSSVAGLSCSLPRATNTAASFGGDPVLHG